MGLHKIRRTGQDAEYYTLNPQGKPIKATAERGEVVFSIYQWGDRVGWEPVDRARRLSEGGGIKIPAAVKPYVDAVKAEAKAEQAAELEATQAAREALERENRGHTSRIGDLEAQIAQLKKLVEASTPSTPPPNKAPASTPEADTPDTTPDEGAAQSTKQVRRRQK